MVSFFLILQAAIPVWAEEDISFDAMSAEAVSEEVADNLPEAEEETPSAAEEEKAEEATAPEKEEAAPKDDANTEKDDTASPEPVPELTYKCKDFTITANGQFEEGTELVAEPLDPEKDDLEQYEKDTAEKVKEDLDETVKNIDLYDIYLLRGSDRFEPSEDVTITITYKKKMDAPDRMRIVHFKEEEDKEDPVILETETSDKEITFATDSFSIYAVVEIEEPAPPEYTPAEAVTELDGNDYILSVTKNNTSRTYYFQDTIAEGNKIAKTNANDIRSAAAWSFEKVSGSENKYVIFLKGEGGARTYMCMNDSGNMSLSQNAGTEFTIELYNNQSGKFYIYKAVGTSKYGLNMFGGESGKGFAGWSGKDDGSAIMMAEVPEEPEQLEEPAKEDKALTKDLEYKDDKCSARLESSEGFEEGTSLCVKEIDKTSDKYGDYLMQSTDVTGLSAGLTFCRIFDISLIKDGKETEPDSTVTVTIKLNERLDSPQIVHFEGDNEEPTVLEAEVSGKKITFETDSFSAYSIVEGPDPANLGLEKVMDIDDLTTTSFYMSHSAGYFFTNQPFNINNSRKGVKKTQLTENPLEAASKYTFEDAGNGKYYIYCIGTSGNRQYLRNNSNNSLLFSDTPVTAFTVELKEPGIILIHNGNWYVNMQGGVNGKAFACYGTNAASDVNSQLCLWTKEDITSDPYGLSGMTYGLMRYTGGSLGKAMMGNSDGTSLDAEILQVMSKESDRNDHIYVPQDSDISMWTFEWADNDNYYLTSEGKYLCIDDGKVTMSDDPVAVTVTPGDGDYSGRIRISSGDESIKYGGSLDAGFIAASDISSDSWLYLVEETPLTPEYKMTYTANKVSVSDTVNVANGKQVVIYTREWNRRLKKYDFYAIDHDGNLVPCTDAGDTIQWIGDAMNTLLWDFTEYYYEDTTTPNHYYDLRNAYSGKYLAPQVEGGQILSDSPIGVNMSGRRYNDYYTPITAWDDPHYAYAALSVNDGEIVSSRLANMSDFYFAVMKTDEDDDELTTVNTVDSAKYGITMKLINFDGNTGQNELLGSSAGGMNVPPTQGLLSTDLDANGYPKATNTGRSMQELFSGATDVNHLFLESTYSSTGYYEFDSTQNFASIQPDNNFKVYKALGTTDVSSRPSLKHGQFFPYNDITAGHFASLNGENLYDAVLHELPDSDPRKYERLHKVDTPDYYFGMEIGASFVQTPSGLDSWGHDIIYEFTGDDDFWLYVDGELIIDLGGIHSALPGSVNYSTGEVNINGTQTTIYNIFKQNYEQRNPGASESEVTAYLNDIFEQNEHGQYLFKDYTTHTMKIFFMERGAGASNLHMKFNLSSIKPGQVILNKQISGTENDDYRLSEYGYQIYYQIEENGPFELLSDTDARGQKTVTYQNTDTPVKYKRTYTPAGSTTTYNNVFFLTPKQNVTITVPDETVFYKIVEVGVNTQVYDEVKINETVTEGIDAGTNRKDYATPPARVNERQRVVFDNHVSPIAERTLTITKKLYDADGTPVHDDPTGFSLRLYLGTENDDDPPAANSHDYHVKDPDGNYCRWDAASGFVSIGKSDYGLLTDAEKNQVTFMTSPNGAISKIPADYKVEVRGLLVGTTFKVEERESEVPVGYSFIDYEREGSSYILHGEEVNSGTIRDNESPAILVNNRRGIGFSVKKDWSDSGFVKRHDRTFFGVYANGSLLPGSVKCLPAGKSRLNWYFDTIGAGISINDCRVMEVTLTGAYTVNGENVIGVYAAHPLDNGDTVEIGATGMADESLSYIYTVTYAEGVYSGPANNIRSDSVTNSRHGIRLVKTDMDDEPLEGAEFTLVNSSGSAVGSGTYTSGADGLITTAYVNVGTGYTLQENSTARGYQPVADSISFIQNADGTVSVTDGNAACTVIQGENGSMPEIRIKNRPFTLKAVKLSDTGTPLGNAHFALHKEVTIGGSPTMSFDPMPGYEDLISSSSDGVIPKITEALPPGTYYIKETGAPDSYDVLENPVKLTISEKGIVTLQTSDGARLQSQTAASGTMEYTLSIDNKLSVIVPSGFEQDKGPYIMLLATAAVVLLISAAFALSADRRKDVNDIK